MDLGVGTPVGLEATAVFAYLEASKCNKPIKRYHQIRRIVQGVLEAKNEGKK